MRELTVMARGGLWMLMDDDEGELGAFDSPAEALRAAGEEAHVDQESRHVLIQDAGGDWGEELVEPPALH